MRRHGLPGPLLLLALLLLAVDVCVGGTKAVTSPSKLRFSKSGTLKILQVTDLHQGASKDADAMNDEAQLKMLQAEQPGLVVFSGDMVDGPSWNGRRGWYETVWRRLIQPVNAAGVPYASILGNHDGEADLSRRDIVELDMRTSNLSLTQQGPRRLTGAGNYYLDVLSSDGKQVAARLWMLDSNNRGCEHVRRGWGCVGSDVVAWVVQEAARLPQVPSLAFIHIPPPQFLELWNNHPTNGTKGELTTCPLLDTGIFTVLREAGVQAIYSGHDHDNDFLGTFEGARLAYGRKTGQGNYGPTGLSHGARVIELRQGESAALSSTWIRRADGQREEQGPSLLEAKAADQQDVCGSDALLLDMFRGVVSLSSYLTSFVVGTALVVATVCMLLRQYVLGNGRQPAAAGTCKGGGDLEECQPLTQGEAEQLGQGGSSSGSGSGCGAFIVSPIALSTAV